MDTNVADLLATAARTEPDKRALSEAATGRSVTWAELDDLADRVAAGLDRAGMVAGYRIALVTGNHIEFVAAYFGALRAHLVVVPVNPRSATGELIRVLVDSGSRMVVADPGTVDLVRHAVEGLVGAIDASPERGDAVQPRVLTVGTPPGEGEVGFDDLVARPVEQPLPVSRDPEALAVLLYTSGTSGTPRGAMLTHRALLANVDQAAAVEPRLISGQDVVLGVLPLFHVYGLNAVLGQVVRQHARLVLVDGFDPEGTLDIVEDEAISVLPVAPAVFAYWMQVPGLEDRLGPVRLALSGSAPLQPELTTAFTERTGVPILQGYGLTEAAPVVTTSGPGDPPATVGRPLPGIELRLVDDTGRTPSDEDGGEIWVRGDNLFSGYWPDGADGPDDEGWWPTGDVGYLDDDGNLYLVDRVKELVIVSGFNVYPSEVEDVIRELPDVAGAAVIGVEDETTGEAVVAYVKPRAEVDPEALAEQVRSHCASRLARFKQPSVVHVVDDLPLTVTGKVQKGRLRATERRRALGLLE